MDNENPKSLIFAKVEDHAKRQWLKLVAAAATLVTGWLAGHGGVSFIVPVGTFIVAMGTGCFELVASKLANQLSIERQAPERKPRSKDRPNYDIVYYGEGTLTPQQKALREKCGIPTGEELQKSNRRIARQQKKVKGKDRYRLRIQEPGKRAKFKGFETRQQATIAFHAESKNGHPDGTIITVIPIKK